MHLAAIAVLIAYGSLLVAGYEKRRTAAHRGLPRISRFDGVREAGFKCTTDTVTFPVRFAPPAWTFLSVAPGEKGHNIPFLSRKFGIMSHLDPAPSRQIQDSPIHHWEWNPRSPFGTTTHGSREEFAKASRLKHEKKRGSPDIPALHRT
jgi:hypothetical protein